MIVLDTDHISALQRPQATSADLLTRRLRDSVDQDIVTTVVTPEEQLRGWLAIIARTRQPRDQVPYYARLAGLFRFFEAWRLLPFDEAAADIYERLRSERVRIGTMDLKVASNVLRHGATLLSGNLRDFRSVPGLQLDSWLNR